jgi:hypothetical protein
MELCHWIWETALLITCLSLMRGNMRLEIRLECRHSREEVKGDLIYE